MQITFISEHRAFVTFVVIAIVVGIYFLFVRPRIKNNAKFKQARGTIIAWLKVRWDMVVALFLALLPILWNGVLDLVVALSIFLGHALPVIAGIDLSAFLLPAWLKTTIQIGAALVPAVRAASLARKTEE